MRLETGLTFNNQWRKKFKCIELTPCISLVVDKQMDETIKGENFEYIGEHEYSIFFEWLTLQCYISFIFKSGK